MSNQKRKHSLFETCINVSSGMLITWLTMQYILAPLLDLPVNEGDNLVITIVLTALSLIKHYTCRRFFTKYIR